jgi:hypothetical protein
MKVLHNKIWEGLDPCTKTIPGVSHLIAIFLEGLLIYFWVAKAAKLISTFPSPSVVAVVGKAMSACFSYPEENVMSANVIT